MNTNRSLAAEVAFPTRYEIVLYVAPIPDIM